MLPSEKRQNQTITTAEAFYKVFRALSKKDRLTVARFILKDKDVQKQIEIPNEVTLESFGENKISMSSFDSINELRKDLLS